MSARKSSALVCSNQTGEVWYSSKTWSRFSDWNIQAGKGCCWYPAFHRSIFTVFTYPGLYSLTCTYRLFTAAVTSFPQCFFASSLFSLSLSFLFFSIFMLHLQHSWIVTDKLCYWAFTWLVFFEMFQPWILQQLLSRWTCTLGVLSTLTQICLGFVCAFVLSWACL